MQGYTFPDRLYMWMGSEGAIYSQFPPADGTECAEYTINNQGIAVVKIRIAEDETDAQELRRTKW